MHFNLQVSIIVLFRCPIISKTYHLNVLIKVVKKRRPYSPYRAGEGG
jgi:hypothetical protein